MVSNNKKYFIKFTDCIIVKGENRATICDLTRNKFHLIPLDLAKFISFSEKKTYEEILAKFSTYKTVVEEYIAFLLTNEIFFWGDNHDIKFFPKLKLNYKSPHTITNTIVEINLQKINAFKNIIIELIALNIKNFQIRFFEIINNNILESILVLFNKSIVSNLELIIPYFDKFDVSYYNSLIINNPRIKKIIVYNYPHSINLDKSFNLIFTPKNLSKSDFYIENPQTFIINHEFFIESIDHNTYFNKKLCIDFNGFIKNSPELELNYGNIEQSKLTDIIQKNDFKNLWFVSKQKIKVCNTCEFRFICFDSRMPLIISENKYYFENSCNLKG